MSKFKKGDRVIYTPPHTMGDIDHKDAERGVVKRESLDFEKPAYFVIYDLPDQKMTTGDEDYTAKLTPADLLHIISWYED